MCIYITNETAAVIGYWMKNPKLKLAETSNIEEAYSAVQKNIMQQTAHCKHSVLKANTGQVTQQLSIILQLNPLQENCTAKIIRY